MSTEQSTVEYRDIKGFPGYRVGSDGSVWSSWHKKGLGWRYGFIDIRGEWHKLVEGRTKSGRPIVCLCPGAKWLQVSHIVLEAFVGPRPPGMECCHDPDYDPCNNSITNIRWDTRKANMQDRERQGRMLRGERHGSAKLTDNDVRSIRQAHPLLPPRWRSIMLARQYGVTSTTICSIIKRKTWKHLS